MAMGAAHGYLEFVNIEIREPQELYDLLVGRGEVDNLLTLRTDGVVVRLELVLVARLLLAQLQLFDELFIGEELEVAVDGGEIDVGEAGVELSC